MIKNVDKKYIFFVIDEFYMYIYVIASIIKTFFLYYFFFPFISVVFLVFDQIHKAGVALRTIFCVYTCICILFFFYTTINIYPFDVSFYYLSICFCLMDLFVPVGFIIFIYLLASNTLYNLLYCDYTRAEVYLIQFIHINLP